MWDTLFQEKAPEFECVIPKYILKRIFGDIDENILDIRELQSEHNKVLVSQASIQSFYTNNFLGLVSV